MPQNAKSGSSKRAKHDVMEVPSHRGRLLSAAALQQLCTQLLPARSTGCLPLVQPSVLQETLRSLYPSLAEGEAVYDQQQLQVWLGPFWAFFVSRSLASGVIPPAWP